MKAINGGCSLGKFAIILSLRSKNSISKQGVWGREAKNNRDKKLKPSKEHLQLLGCGQYITNVARETWSGQTLILAYTLRWRIEIIFKSWKSCLNFDIKSKMSLNQVNLLIYSRLIIVTVITAYYYPRFEQKVYNRSKKNISLIKFIGIIIDNSEEVRELFDSTNTRKRKLLMDILCKNAAYETCKRTNFAR